MTRVVMKSVVNPQLGCAGKLLHYNKKITHLGVRWCRYEHRRTYRGVRTRTVCTIVGGHIGVGLGIDASQIGKATRERNKKKQETKIKINK